MSLHTVVGTLRRKASLLQSVRWGLIWGIRLLQQEQNPGKETLFTLNNNAFPKVFLKNTSSMWSNPSKGNSLTFFLKLKIHVVLLNLGPRRACSKECCFNDQTNMVCLFRFPFYFQNLQQC